MRLTIDCQHSFTVELHRTADLSEPALQYESAQGDLAALVEESFIRAVLAEQLPLGASTLECHISPQWLQQPYVSHIAMTIGEPTAPVSQHFQTTFATGAWIRRSQLQVEQWRQQGGIAADEQIYLALLATPTANNTTGFRPPILQAPPVVDQTLEQLGVRHLHEGAVSPQRPVLVSHRMEQDIIEATRRAGMRETGGGALGKIVRLPESLPGSTTRIVTVLTMSVTDPRHEGSALQLSFNQQALAEADQIAQLRDRGEAVLTAYHSHGWGDHCGQCNEQRTCPLPRCDSVSLQDYDVLECLFPSKATLMPIAGRKPGAAAGRPVLEIHAWHGGEMKPIHWLGFDE